MPVHRNRVIYQSEALFISPDSTGYHFTGALGPVTDSAGVSHTAHWGLATPPKDVYQVVGQKSDGAGGWETARNEAGQSVGWTCEDGMAAWPDWNPKGLPGSKASFGPSDVDMDNLTEIFDFEASVAPSVGENTAETDIVLEQAAGGTLTLAQLAAAATDLAGNARPVTITKGDGSLVLDNADAPSGGQTITLTNAQVPVIEAQAGIVYSSGGSGELRVIIPGSDGNKYRFTFTDTVGATLGVVFNDPSIDVTYDSANPAHTFGALSNLIDADAGIGAVIANTAPVGTDFTDAIPAAYAVNLAPNSAGSEFTAGVDGVAAIKASALNVTVQVESKLAGVEIVADDEGSHGNITLTQVNETSLNGNPGSGPNGTVTVQDLVDAYNASKNPNHTALTVVSGGSNVPNTGVQITLSGGRDWYAKSHGTIIQQLHRVQSANYGFTVNRQDINQFGHASRLDSIVVESPTVNLDFSYYLLDGRNERLLEFVTDGATNTLSGLLTPELYQAGNNFFILTAPEARDAVRGDVSLNENDLETKKSVISLGNGYITDYSIDISVGSIPTASVTVEGMNIKSDFGTTGNDVPAVDMRNGSRISDAWDRGANGDQPRACKAAGCTGLYSLPPAVSGYDGCLMPGETASDADGDGKIQSVAALRPGDVLVDLSSKSLISKSVAGNSDTPVIGSAHVQSASMSLPLGRTTLQRLGSVFGFSKAIDLPLSVSMSFNALVADLKEGNMMDLLCDCNEFDVGITIFKPECAGCTVKDITDPDAVAMRFTMKGARLESENFSSTIGDNKSVDLTFTTQIGSSDDMENGLYIYGSEAKDRVKQGETNGLPPAWTGVGGQTIDAVDGYLFGYRA